MQRFGTWIFIFENERLMYQATSRSLRLLMSSLGPSLPAYYSQAMSYFMRVVTISHDALHNCNMATIDVSCVRARFQMQANGNT